MNAVGPAANAVAGKDSGRDRRRQEQDDGSDARLPWADGGATEKAAVSMPPNPTPATPMPAITVPSEPIGAMPVAMRPA